MLRACDDETRLGCRYLGIRNKSIISLLVSTGFRLEELSKIKLSRKGIKSSVVGELTEPREGMVLIRKGREEKLEHPIVDPFWKAFYNTLTKHKS